MPAVTVVSVAGGVVLDERSRVLLLHRREPRPRWELPGGKVERGESPEAAVCRELAEELGAVVEVGPLLGRCRFVEGRQTIEYSWYRAAIVQGSPVPVEAVFDRVRFMADDEARSLWDQLSLSVQHLLGALPAWGSGAGNDS